MSEYRNDNVEKKEYDIHTASERDKINRERQRQRQEAVRREKKVLAVSGILIIVLMVMISIFSCGSVKTENRGAKHVTKKGCTAFYPKKTKKYGKEYAKELVRSGKKDMVFDYKESKLNDCHIYYYGKGKGFMTDKDYKPVTIKELTDESKMVISDYLRYTMKKKNRDEAYTSKFMEDTYYDTITTDRFTYGFNDKNLICYFKEYKINVYIPYKYISDILSTDIGIKKEKYKKPIYVNPDRPIVALTFDDGPDVVGDSTQRILDELYKYDGVGTFFIVGRNLGENVIPVLEKGIRYGNQYGSHSTTHPELPTLTSSEITDEVMYVSNFFEENLGYKMNTYRPPYGSYDDVVDAAVPLAAILWDVDSLDWKLRDGAATLNKIKEDIFNGAVVLMHDIHVPSADTICDAGLVKWLVDEGYQLVDVNTLADIKGIELTQGVHLCWD